MIISYLNATSHESNRSAVLIYMKNLLEKSWKINTNNTLKFTYYDSNLSSRWTIYININ